MGLEYIAVDIAKEKGGGEEGLGGGGGCGYRHDLLLLQRSTAVQV